MSDAHAWVSADHVLCVRLNTLEGVLLTTPALRAVKASRPARRITLLTLPAGAEAAPCVPEIDAVLTCDARAGQATGGDPDGSADQALIDRLRHGRFDAAVIFTAPDQDPLPAASLCHAACIPLRLAHCRASPDGLLSDWVADTEPVGTARHEVRRQLDLVAAVGCRTDDDRLSFRVTERAVCDDLRLLYRLGIDQERPWVILHAGAGAASRRYPREAFAEVARQLTMARGVQVLFTGSPEERELVEWIRDAMGAPSWSAVGLVSLEELGALIALAWGFIASHSGLVHIAAAQGTPVVDLYALTRPQQSPWRVPHRVLSHEVPCKFCYQSVCPEGHHHCLRLVAPGAVVEATCELLSECGVRLPFPYQAGSQPEGLQPAFALMESCA
jgi:ADP-heptose:LPS heptosyltransferase